MVSFDSNSIKEIKDWKFPAVTYSLVLKHKGKYILHNEEIKKKQHIYVMKLKLFYLFFQLLTPEKMKGCI